MTANPEASASAGDEIDDEINAEINGVSVAEHCDTTDVPATAHVPATADILAKLRAKSAERIAAAQYPADLPVSMEGHFHRLVRQRPPDERAAEGVDAAIARARDASRFAVERIPVTSSKKFGGFVHRMLRKLFFRQAQGIIAQVQPATDRLNDAVETLAGRVHSMDESLGREVRGLDERWGIHLQRQRIADAKIEALERRLAEDIETEIQRDRLAGAEESRSLRFELAEVRADLVGLASSAETLRATLESLVAGLGALQQIETDRKIRPWYDNASFEARFRGSRFEILNRYRDLAKHFVNCGPVLDIGCGRGEMLELLGEFGIECYGIEIDAELVETVKKTGARATVADARTHVASRPDGSLGGICMIQVVEHFTQQELLDIIALAFRKLRPGGKLVMETVNAKSLFVYAHSFYLDPTHTRPVHPEYLEFLCIEAGFDTVEVEWRSELPQADRLGALPKNASGARLMNDNVDRLNRLLYSPLDYAIVASK